MEKTRPQPHESLARQHFRQVESIVTLLEWLLVAFILALLFQGFAVQAFQIPTGSMAETLRGAHYRMRCMRCAFHFDTDVHSVGLSQAKCPNCDYYQPTESLGDPKNGDRIFVLKSIYQFSEPKRWDVVVFKNPTNPRDNYIKRLIALPGEEVQLIDGDVYIRGLIKRKPYKVQQELWMPIYLQDYQPFDAVAYLNQQVENGQDPANSLWTQPFTNANDSQWQLDPAAFSLDSSPKTEHVLNYQSNNPDDFRATYAYNDSAGYSYKPMVSDLMITFYAQCNDKDGVIGASLEKYGVLYSARVDMTGAIVLSRTVDDTTEVLRRTLTGGLETGKFEKFEFANVDHQLVVRWADKRVTYNLALDKDFLESAENFQQLPIAQEKSPTVQIIGAGNLSVRHVGLYRDTFYMGNEAGYIRGTEDRPFLLEVDQFFVCGDNSNNSHDSRAWATAGIGNNGLQYREGIVPRDYMMGKAVLVYWSQAFMPARKTAPLIPNFSNIKVIAGGSEQEY